MTQEERIDYYFKAIHDNESLKNEIYDKCDLELYSPEELQDDLKFLLEGGIKHNYKLLPFASDGCGGVCVLIDNKHIALIDSEGRAGYVAESIDDFINILFIFGFIPYYKSIFKGLDEFNQSLENDLSEYTPSNIIIKFLIDEKMELDKEKLYYKLLKGCTILPLFIIEPTDNDYTCSENLFGFDEEDFYELCYKTKTFIKSYNL